MKGADHSACPFLNWPKSFSDCKVPQVNRSKISSGSFRVCDVFFASTGRLAPYRYESKWHWAQAAGYRLAVLPLNALLFLEIVNRRAGVYRRAAYISLIPHSSFLIPHSSFLIPHSSFPIPHSPFLTALSFANLWVRHQFGGLRASA